MGVVTDTTNAYVFLHAEGYNIDNMPNIVTHLQVTDRVFPGAPTDLLLGSTLPDFHGMIRDYASHTAGLDAAQASEHLSAGVDFHHKTDEVFDTLPVVRALLEVGEMDCHETIPDLPQGAARKIASMGTDILFDVPVIESLEGRRLYTSIRAEIMAGRTALANSGDSKIMLAVRNYFGGQKALNYWDTKWLAAMMNYRFSLRATGSLEFGTALVPPVADMLSRQLERIRNCADQVLDATVETLST